MSRRQKQAAGSDSANVLAGRDVEIHVGLSLEQARQVALDLFEANFLRMSSTAAELAFARVKDFVRDFLDELQARAPEALKSVEDPDMQRTIFNAQAEYAYSGDGDLEKVLIDLLVDRAQQNTRDLKTVVLNEAVPAVGKLTDDQRSAIAICFLVRHTIYRNASLADFYGHLETGWVPFISNLPSSNAAYQHIQYVGVAQVISLSQLTIETALSDNEHAFFAKGFGKSDVPESLQPYIGDSKFFVPCFRNPELLQVNATTAADLKGLQSELKMRVSNDELSGPIETLFNTNMMPVNEIKDDVIKHVPALEHLFRAWNNSPIRSMELTSVGLAIGHAYWRRVTGQNSDLDNWLTVPSAGD